MPTTEVHCSLARVHFRCKYLSQCLLQRKWTPLYAAAYRGHMDIVQYLVEKHGCDPAVVTTVSGCSVLSRDIMD